MNVDSGSSKQKNALLGLGLLAAVGWIAATVAFISIAPIEKERARQQMMQENNWQSLGRCGTQLTELRRQVAFFPNEELTDWRCNDPFGSDPQQILNAFMMQDAIDVGYITRPADCSITSSGWDFKVAAGIPSPDGTKILIPFSIGAGPDPTGFAGFFVMQHGFVLPSSWNILPHPETEAAYWAKNIRWISNSNIAYDEYQLIGYTEEPPVKIPRTFIIK